MAEVSITLAEVSMIFGRTVMADVSLDRSVNGPIRQWADQSDIFYIPTAWMALQKNGSIQGYKIVKACILFGEVFRQ